MVAIRRISRSLWPIDSIENHTFFPQVFRPGDVVIDLGANRGVFSSEINRRYGVRCHGMEPNPNLFAKLLSDDKVRFHNLAITDNDAPITLNLSDDITSSSVVSSDVPSPTGQVQVMGKKLTTFFKEQGISRVALMKVDVEGAEVGLFASTPDDLLQQISQIAIEFHDDHRLITREQFEEIRRRLLRLGFEGIKFASNNTNWLFYQPGKVSVNSMQGTYVRLLIRNVRGALRKMGFRNN